MSPLFPFSASFRWWTGRSAWRRASLATRQDSSGDRMLAVLGLFTVEQPEWTVEAAAAELGVSPTTAYRYFKRLTNVGLLSPVSRGDLCARARRSCRWTGSCSICDPMLRAARPVMIDLIQYAAEGSVLLLCRLFHDRVMCMHQVMGRGPQEPVSYERGRLIPLFRGATSKIILANLPARTLKLLVRAECRGDCRGRARPDLGRVPQDAGRAAARRYCGDAWRPRSRPHRHCRSDLRRAGRSSAASASYCRKSELMTIWSGGWPR